MAYKDLKAPKKEMSMDDEFEADMMSELELEDEEMGEEDMSGMDLTAISDDELMAELKARGLLDSEEDLEEDEDLDI